MTHPMQKVHWQHRSLAHCNVDRVISIAESVRKKGLTSFLREIMELMEERRMGSAVSVAREVFDSSARDLIRDGHRLQDTKESLEALVLLGYLRRARSHTKFKKTGYSTPQSVTYYVLNINKDWRDA